MQRMKVKRSDGTVFHKLGDLRIAGPAEEVEPFLEWLKEQNCYIWGSDEIQAPRELKAVDMSLDIYFKET